MRLPSTKSAANVANRNHPMLNRRCPTHFHYKFNGAGVTNMHATEWK